MVRAVRSGVTRESREGEGADESDVVEPQEGELLMTSSTASSIPRKNRGPHVAGFPKATTFPFPPLAARHFPPRSPRCPPRRRTRGRPSSGSRRPRARAPRARPRRSRRSPPSACSSPPWRTPSTPSGRWRGRWSTSSGPAARTSSTSSSSCPRCTRRAPWRTAGPWYGSRTSPCSYERPRSPPRSPPATRRNPGTASAAPREHDDFLFFNSLENPPPFVP